ncbi:hypothetical protein FIE12Z_5927 [Fusarium flagelliforme]|uniref:F-box domain-containing protein n=1 Tax=Fusarium flagelliforme TaxID=2675880 RepID=A0A395MRM9_9HYPO|nr:hypothetical protein FIE12Z_5927 [Fusarium flagelliforme]
MGYSEILCHLCGVSFNICRVRTENEPPEAAWGSSINFEIEEDPDESRCEKRCFFVQTGADLQSTTRMYGGEALHSHIPEDELEHIPGPKCTQDGGYSGHHISVEAMKGCQEIQCLVPKPDDWEPQTDDEAFEISSSYFLSGLSDYMPSRDIGDPELFPARHGESSPYAENVLWDPEEAGKYSMPFHPTCFEIFKRASLRRQGVVDVEGMIQWWRLEGNYEDYHGFPRDPAVRQASQQWWEHNVGDEYLVANPCFVPGLEPLLQTSGQKTDSQNGDSELTHIMTTGTANDDPFAKLPAEIKHAILVELSFKDIASLKLVSRAFQHLPNSVLYEVTVRDTPWLYEAWSSLPISFWATTTKEAMVKKWDDDTEAFNRSAHPAVPVRQLSRTGTDWLRLHAEIFRNRKSLLGLQNRRRIWKDCEEILDRIEKYRNEGKIVQLGCPAPAIPRHANSDSDDSDDE